MFEDARQLASWIRNGLKVGGSIAENHPNILFVALIGKLVDLEAAERIQVERWGGLGSIYDRLNSHLRLPRLLVMRVADRSLILQGSDPGYLHEHVAQLLDSGSFDDVSASAA